jgi:uncharacterized protein (TIGR02996 family)
VGRAGPNDCLEPKADASPPASDLWSSYATEPGNPGRREMNDVELTRRAVVDNPIEDTPRLIHADALDERGGPGDAARALFIRKQIELHAIGMRPHQVDAIPMPRGVDHIEIIAGEHETSDPIAAEIRPGVRVDVVTHNVVRPTRKPQKLYNLLVVKILPDDPAAGTVRVLLKRDEYSKPYPYREVRDLLLYCNSLVRDSNWQQWITCPLPPSQLRGSEYRNHPNTSIILFGANLGLKHTITLSVHHNWAPPDQDQYGGGPRDGLAYWEIERGFVSHVKCPWQHWKLWGDKLVAHEPITDVGLVTWPDFDRQGSGIDGFAGKLFDDGCPAYDMATEIIRDTVSADGMARLLNWRWPTIPPQRWRISNTGQEYMT